MRLEGKVALITGAGSGMGRAAAERFGAEGAAVACADLDRDAAEASAEAVREGGGRAIAIAADVTSPAQVEAAVPERLVREIDAAHAGVAAGSVRRRRREALST